MTNNNRFLFRAWDTTNQQMDNIDPGEANDTEGVNTLIDSCIESGLILMQCTGLTDKNGVKIFEGDIVRWFSSEDEGGEFDLGVIEFVAGGFKLTFENSYGGFQAEISEEFEVIGNIYQNKDLLDKKDA